MIYNFVYILFLSIFEVRNVNLVNIVASLEQMGVNLFQFFSDLETLKLNDYEICKICEKAIQSEMVTRRDLIDAYGSYRRLKNICTGFTTEDSLSIAREITTLLKEKHFITV